LSWKIPLFKIYWDDKDINAVSSVLKKGSDWAKGPEVAKFEREICEYMGIEYAVTVNSGTTALHAALIAYGIGNGDEVIVPSFTFIATANAPLFVGAKPVFADIEEETYGLDPVDVEKKITPRTKAIIPIHYGGEACHIKALKRIAEKHHLILIEDAAESLGAMVNGKKVGTFGDSAILSFCANKVISTGEGGAILTDSMDIYKKLTLICNHGRLETGDYFSSTEQMEYVALGYNFRMSTMTAALGLAQLGKLNNIIHKRIENAQYMSQKLSMIKGVKVPLVPQGFSHVYQLYTIRLNERGDLRDKLMNYLISKGIMAKVYFYPVHQTSFYRQQFGYCQGWLPITEKIAAEVLTLPMYPTLTKEEIDYIAKTVENFLIKGK